jgi:glucosamine-6-phosphate deaminase
MTTRRHSARSRRTARGLRVTDGPSRKNEHAEAFPDYLHISASDLGKGQTVRVRVSADAQALSRDLAEAILSEIQQGEGSGRGATLIAPVGPVDHFPILAALINEQKLSCRNTVFINMDEYVTEGDDWISPEHALSFRGYMDRAFYKLLEPDFAPPPENRIFPDPTNPKAIAKLISARGGVDACFGGIGINGHLAFNEPPEPGVEVSIEDFANLPTRVLGLSRETRTINSVTVGGEIGVIPKRAITIGMREILASRRLRFYCNRPWQSAVIRRALHGPLTPSCPASYLRTHPDACVTVADFVAAPPDIQLR